MTLSVVAFCFEEHCGQNHMLSPERDCDCKRWLREVEMCFIVDKVKISNLSSLTEEQKQVSQVTVDCKVVEIMSSARGENPLKSSSSTRKISGTSCWVLKLKGASRIEEILNSKALKKFDGSTGADERFNKDILSATDFTNGVSDGDWDHKEGMMLNTCRIELA
jgi:hypothetical protein